MHYFKKDVNGSKISSHFDHSLTNKIQLDQNEI